MEDNTRYRRIFEFVLIFGLAILTLAVLMVLFGSSAQADIIVDQAGNGDFLTIQEGIDNAVPGENVFVWDGSYNENITIDKSVQLIGNGSATTIIDGFGTNNHIINIIAEGVEITGFNITESGTWYGIWANVGGFNIHHNIFNTQGWWAISMDIDQVNSGSVTVGDITVENNEVLGIGGFNFNIWYESPLPSSNLVIGDTIIANNTLHNTQTGIAIDRYTVFNMNQGSITWGDIMVKDNFVNSSISEGIFFWGIFWNITDVNIDLGKMDFSDNNVTAQSNGIYIDWWDFADGIYGNTIATAQDTYVYNNDIICQSDSGIYLHTDVIGHTIYDSTSVTTGDFYIFSNNITTAGIISNGIYVDISQTGRDMYDDSSVNFGNIYIDSNFIESNDYGIYFNYMNSFGTDTYNNALVNIGDVQVTNNEIFSVDHGVSIYFDTVGNTMYDQVSSIIGNILITRNNITSTADGINLYMVSTAYNMYNDSSVDIGNYNIESNIINAGRYGIYFETDVFGSYLYGNAQVTSGNILVTHNNVNSSNHGIYLLRTFCGEVVYGLSSVSFGNIIIDDNEILSGGNGIYLYMNHDGISIWNNASMTMGYFTIENNNITSATHGIFINVEGSAQFMFNYTMFSMGDLTINYNNINSTSWIGIHFGFINIGHIMEGNATATFGNFIFTNNNITAFDDGMLFEVYDIGIDMHDRAVLTMKDFVLNNNILKCGPSSDVIDIVIINIGGGMHGDSYISLGSWNIEDNTILSGYYGIHLSSENLGYDMADNSNLMYGDLFIINNVVNVTGNGGIEIDYMKYGMNMAGSSSVTGGNMSIINNIVASRDQFGFLLWYDRIGNNLYNSSYISTGWIDISHNNFSSVINHGAYIWMDYNGAYMYGNSQVFIGDIMFTHNDVWSDTEDALHFANFFGNAYQMHNDTYFQIGNILVNDNYLDAGGTGDGIELYLWQQNAYEMSHNASADFGDFEFNRNTIEAGANGIYANNIEYWACYLYWNNHVTMGHWQFNDNKINAKDGTGIGIFKWYDIGTYIYGTSTLTVGNLEVLRNVINAIGSEGMDVSIRHLAYYNYGSSQCYFGDFLFNNNKVNASCDGIYISAIQDSAYYMFNNSYAHFGNFEVNNNDIDAGYGSPLGYDGIYFYFYDNGYKMYDNSEAYFGHLQINNNTITCHDDDGILLDVFSEIGDDIYDDSYFEIGNLEMCLNWIDANDVGMNIPDLSWLAGTQYNSTAVFGDFLFDANTIYAGTDGIYINAHYWASTMTGTTSATFGDLSVSNNIIESGYQGIYCQFEYAGYDMHDMTRFEMGSMKILNNTIISGQDPASLDSYGIFFQTQYVGYEMHNETQAIVGPILFNDNTVTVLFGSAASGIYIGWMSDYGAYMYDMASFTMNGNIEVCRNTINTTNGDDGIKFDTWNFGSYLYGDNTVSFGNLLFNDNTIIDAYDTGIYISMSTIGYFTHGNSSVTIGNIELNNNDDIQIVNGSYFSGIYFYLDDIGSNMYDGSIFNMGHVQMNDNNIYNSSGYGLEIEAYRLGYEMHNSSNAYFGNFEVLRNNITSINDGIFLFGFQNFAAYMYNNASAFFGDFLVNNNIISTKDPEGDGVHISAFRDMGYQMNGQSYAEFGNFECSGNEVNVPSLAYGISISTSGCANNMYDNATFIMGDWLINNNTVFTSEYEGIQFDCDSFGYNLYDNSSAYLGKNEIMYNTVNSTRRVGIETWWWYGFGNYMYDYSYFEVGNCYIMFNNITSTSSLHYGLETGPYSIGEFVRDEAEAYFGDYIISNNIIYSEGTEGIYLWYDHVVYRLDNTNLPECRAVVEVGRVMVTDNVITVPNGKGIYIDGWDVAYSLNDHSSVITGGIHINRNTINSFGHGIDIYMYELGENNDNNAQVWLGSFVIDDNVITATNGNGIYIYSEFFAYSTNNNAFVHMDDFYFTNNDIVAGITGIEFICQWWIELYDSSEARAPGLWITGNNVSAPVSALNYTTLNTPTRIDPGTTFSSGNVTISDNIFDGGLFGVMINWRDMLPSGEGQPDFYFENNSIENGAANSIGLYMMNIQNSTIESLNIDSYDQGIYVSNSNIWYMFNSTISNIPSYDLNLTAASFIGAVNTTFDNASVYFEDDICLLNVGWFMNVYVQSQVFLPVPEANVTVKDVDGTEVFNSTANLVGQAFYIICWEYQENITGIIKNFNDYTADANKGGSFGSAVPNPTMNQTRLVVITLLDLIPPMIFADNSDTAGTTGDPFYFEINASDNMGIVSVHVNFRLGGVGPYTNRTMNGTGPYWLNEPMLSDYVGFIEYYFTALDSGGFWVNTTPTTAPITDNDAPTIISDNSDILATTGDTFNFIVDATDNIDISEVHVVWWFGAGAPTNNTMIGTGPYTFSIPVPLNSLDQLHYYFTMTDSAGNWLVGPQVDVNVSDNDAPTYIWISQPTEGYTGDSVSVSIQATDNIDLAYYKIEVDGILYDLIKDGDFYNFTINIPSDSLAPITYSIILNDSADNPNIIAPTQIIVTDNDQPTYSWVLQPTTGTTGESVELSIMASDNIGITYYKIEIDGMLYDMIKDGNYYNYTIDIPPDSVNPLTYSIVLNDSADNPNIITPPVITVIDNDAPTFTWVSRPTTGVVGSSVLVSLTGYDNIGITNYTIYIDGVPFDMVKDGDYYNYTINIPPGIPVNITYNVTLRDAAGNPVTTGDTVIGVISVDDEVPQYSWILHPTTGTTGESVLVSLLATDNIGITYYKIEVDGTLYDLVKEGDYYNYTINIPGDSLASITYSVTFNDAADNPVTTPDTTITVTDNDAPTYTWVLHPSTGTAGGSVPLSLTASDNIGITYYKIDIDGTLYDLIKDGDYFNYTINLPPGSSASITYDITFKDEADNQISTGDTVITVTIPMDTDPPEFTWVLHPDAGTTGDSLLVSVIATDNIGITYYKISVNGILYDLVKNGNYYNYTINIPTDSLASITYFVVFNDSANNPNTATSSVITVTDNDPATISNPASDTSGKKGKEFRFQIDASDNIGISEVKVWYWFGDDDSQKISLTLSEENGTYSGSITPEESGDLHYYFEVTDDAGNTFQSDEYTVAIGAAEKEDEEELNVLPFIIIVIIIIVVLLLFLLTRKKKEVEEIPEVEEGLAEGEEGEKIEAEEVEGEELEEGAEEEREEEEIEGEEPEEEVELEESEPDEEIDLEEETEDREL